MNSNLYLKDTYLSMNYIISNYIREYDMSKANISILYSKGCITKQQYDYYYNMDKNIREIQIGLLQRDNKHINQSLRDGFKEYRKLFFEVNNINDGDVLAIKKDAIFLINKTPKELIFDEVEFKFKNLYTSFYKFNNIEFYYYLDKMKNIERIDLKGINPISAGKHTNHLLDYLYYIFEFAQTSDIQTVIQELTNFIQLYMNRELDIEFYREFNLESGFKVHSNVYSFVFENMNDKDKQHIDISYNLGILNTLLSYYTQVYLQKSNKIRV